MNLLRPIDQIHTKKIGGSDSDHQLIELLRNVTTIYTDLDGTMLAPGGRVLCATDGSPSAQLAEALVGLRAANIDVVIVTGRTRKDLASLCRVLGIERFAAELGTVHQQGHGVDATITYLTGEMPFDPQAGSTPRELIWASSAVDELLDRFAGSLELSPFNQMDFNVSTPLRGNINVAQAQDLLDEGSLPLTLIDNGIIRAKDSSLDLKEIHIYHLLPRGCSKLEAVTFDQAMLAHATRGTSIAVGDSAADVAMGGACDLTCIMHNALGNPAVIAAAEELIEQALDALAGSTTDAAIDTTLSSVRQNKPAILATTRPCIDGWVELANLILNLK